MGFHFRGWSAFSNTQSASFKPAFSQLADIALQSGGLVRDPSLTPSSSPPGQPTSGAPPSGGTSFRVALSAAADEHSLQFSEHALKRVEQRQIPGVEGQLVLAGVDKSACGALLGAQAAEAAFRKVEVIARHTPAARIVHSRWSEFGNGT